MTCSNFAPARVALGNAPFTAATPSPTGITDMATSGNIVPTFPDRFSGAGISLDGAG